MKNKDIFISPLEDFAFKQIFGEKRNIDNTKVFLETLLNIPENEIGRLTVTNLIFGKLFRKDKSGVVDIRLESKSGKIYHIELQVQKRTNTRNRVLYYGSRLIGDQLKISEKFSRLHHVISIVICDHVLLEEEDSYINVYELKNDKNRTFTDLLKVVIIELPKLSEEEDSAIWPWLKFLKCKKKEEFKMLAIKFPQLKKPVECVRRMGLIESIRDYYFHYNLAKEDERMLHLQWKLDGKAEEKLTIARNLIAEGSTPEFIHKITGLSLEEIEKLKNILIKN